MNKVNKLKSTELRIGNIVSFKGLWDGEIEAIEKIAIIIKDNEGVFSIDSFEPVNLSAEVLQRYGFTKVNNAWVLPDYYDKSEFSTEWKFSIWNSWENEYEYNSAEFPVPLHSLHQLQNLYFTLTGEELNIKTINPIN